MTAETPASTANAPWRSIITLLAAGAGVVAATWIGAPLPALLGAVVGAALGGLAFRADINPAGRNVGLTLLGLQIGSGFSPQAVDRLAHAPIAFLGLIVSTAGAFLGAFVIYRWVSKWDRDTAVLAAMPGGVATVMALLSDGRADAARVAIAQSVRLGALVVGLPLIISAAPVSDAGPVWSWPVSLAMAAAAAVTGWILERRKTPAGALLGPALVSATATLAGWVEGAPPAILFLTGLWIIGASTGARISRGTAAAWRDNIATSLLALGVAAAAAFATAALIAPFTALSFQTLALAFAPGGIDAMVAVAAGLALDPAFVAACHIVRVVGITLLLPLIFRRVVGRPSDDEPDD